MISVKILLLSFDKNEEELLNAVMSVLDNFGIKTQSEVINSNSRLSFKGIYIDKYKRKIEQSIGNQKFLGIGNDFYFRCTYK